MTVHAPIGAKLALELLERHQSVNGHCADCGSEYPCDAPGVVWATQWLNQFRTPSHASKLLRAVGVCAVPDNAGPGDQVEGRRANGDVAAPLPHREVTIGPGRTGVALSPPARVYLVKTFGTGGR